MMLGVAHLLFAWAVVAAGLARDRQAERPSRRADPRGPAGRAVRRADDDGRTPGLDVTLTDGRSVGRADALGTPPSICGARRRRRPSAGRLRRDEPDVRLVSRRPSRRGDAVWPLSGRLATRSERTIQVGPTTHVEDESGLGLPPALLRAERRRRRLGAPHGLRPA